MKYVNGAVLCLGVEYGFLRQAIMNARKKITACCFGPAMEMLTAEINEECFYPFSASPRTVMAYMRRRGRLRRIPKGVMPVRKRLRVVTACKELRRLSDRIISGEII